MVFSTDGQERGRLKYDAADIGVDQRFELDCFIVTPDFEVRKLCYVMFLLVRNERTFLQWMSAEFSDYFDVR